MRLPISVSGPLGASWLDYFDLVVCGARKPGFLLDPYLPIFQARDNSPPTLPPRHHQRGTGTTERQDLCNSPSPPSPDPAPPPPPPCQVRQDGSLENAEIIGPQDGARLLQRSRVFQGGNWQHLHALLQLASGSGLLYVGAYLP